MTQKQELQKLKAIVAENVDRVSAIEEIIEGPLLKTKYIVPHNSNFLGQDLNQQKCNCGSDSFFSVAGFVMGFVSILLIISFIWSGKL